MSRPKVLLIAGMHRSGTSACAGVLYRLGFDFGKELMEAAPDNERGYYENSRIYRFHEQVIELLGTTWDGVLSWPADWTRDESLRGCREELAGILESEFTAGRPLAVKDPRLCRLWPLWRQVLDEKAMDYGLIIPLRNPLEVALSLQKRNGFSRETANLLWLIYNFEIEASTRDVPRVFLNFGDLLLRPEEVLESLALRLRIEWPRNVGEGLPAIRTFLDRSLVHHDRPDPGPGTSPWPAAAELHAALRSLVARDDANSPARIAIDQLRSDFTAAVDFFYTPEMRRIFRFKAALKAEEEEKRRAIIGLEEQLSEANARIFELNRHIQGFIQSKSWRIFAPARAAKRAAASGLARLKEGSIRETRALYHRLPLTAAAKSRLKRGLFLARGVSLRKNGGFRPQDGATAPSASKRSDPRLEFRRNLEKMDRPDFSFPQAVRPDISIIVPAHDKIEYTFNCLKSIRDRVSSGCSYEVLAVDDGSTDRTTEVLSRIPGLRVIRNEDTLGFVESCNRAADEARGAFLVFLNNDALVRPDWLEGLRRTFEDFPDAGLAGSKIIFPEGLLQEAGGLIWRDGRASHIGRLDDPDRPVYGYLREVDYCSGASLMIPRDLFFRLDKFDRRFAPAYYEDVDLAFKVRAAGKKVFYQPLSEVVHFEGISHGTDVRRGLKRYQEVNRRKFAEKWGAALEGRPEKGSEPERRSGKRILICDECVCLPDQDAGSLRMMNIIRILQNLGFTITFYPDNGAFLQPYTRNMHGLGVEVLKAPSPRSLVNYLRKNGPAFDAVILSRLRVAQRHIRAVRRYARTALILFDTVDLHFLREEREAALKGSAGLQRAAQKTRRAELETAALADVTLVVNEAEKKTLEDAVPGLGVKIIAMIHPRIGSEAGFDQRRDLLFVGGFRFAPNVDAVLYFAREILPLIRRHLKGLKVHVVGGSPPPEIQALAAADLLVAGQVADIEPYLRSCRLSVAPLRWGAGVKGKITLSLSRGLPVVATRMAAEGMGLTPGRDVLAAGDAESFARAAVEAYGDANLWTALSAGGLEYVRKHHSVEAATRTLGSVLGGAGRRFEREGGGGLGN